MKTLRQIVLICFTSSVLGQTLPLPPRASLAPDGDAFIKIIAPLELAARDEAIIQAFLAGNTPDSLRNFCAVTVTNIADGRTNIATLFVAPDYLAIGRDENYFYAPVSPLTAQRLADKLNCLLPTRKMVDAIYAAAKLKLAPAPIPPSAAMTTVPVFAQHNEIIRRQRMALTDPFPLGTLVAGHKKDVVISARLASVTNKVAIYGWQQTNGVAIQPLYLGHAAWWVDYSQGLRLVSQTMLVNGEKRAVADVLADPKLCSLISDEGMVNQPRYPTNASAPPAAAEPLNLPWPQHFFTSTNFGEMIREINLPEDVRIVLNAPARTAFSPDKPVRLVFYALPNGNTIEPTLGQQPRPGDDWHFDLQHIGAQTRWLRRVITNQTIVVAYLEAGTKSWPAWRKNHGDARMVEILDGVCGIFSSNRTEVVLSSHSGGGSLIFGYLNAVEKIPDAVKRIAFLDSDYGYDSKRHADKIKNWLAASAENHLCVLAYQDYLARLNGKTFVSEAGGTWGRSQLLLADLKQEFHFTSWTNGGLEVFSSAGGQVEFLLKENPERKVFHTVQVERNGFIESLLSGTAAENQGYEYFGERVYTNWITAQPW